MPFDGVIALDAVNGKGEPVVPRTGVKQVRTWNGWTSGKAGTMSSMGRRAAARQEQLVRYLEQAVRRANLVITEDVHRLLDGMAHLILTDQPDDSTTG